jgi:cardiolipin synthase (CMP-forming)
MRPIKDALVNSILLTVAAFQLAQFALFLGYALPFGFSSRYILPFALSSVAFHGLLLGMLFIFRNDFVKVPEGERLTKVNLANKITLFRVSTLPTLLFVILASKDYPIRYPLIALVAIVFLTDFLDGYVSRKAKEVTRVGKMMDSASDYTVLFVISIVYYYFHIIPAWFLVLFAGRLAGQTLMMLTVLAVKKRITPRTSFMGKLTIASTMVLYAVELLRFVASLPAIAFTVMELVVGAIIVLSIVDKIAMMAQDLRAPAAPDGGSGRLNVTENGVPHAH